MGIRINLPARFTLSKLVDQCFFRSFPEDDFFITVRTIPGNKPDSILAKTFFPKDKTSATNINIDGRDYLQWKKQDIVNGNKVATIIYIFSEKNQTYSVWISYKIGTTTENLFSGIFFTVVETQ